MIGVLTDKISCRKEGTVHKSRDVITDKVDYGTMRLFVGCLMMVNLMSLIKRLIKVKKEVE